MALDEALAESVRAGGSPFLRFYSWIPGTLSLGRFQNLSTGLSEAARTVPRVRRPTGGGGIWHDQELTYSLACLQSHLEVQGVKASFEKLCGFLLDTWAQFGWNAQFAKDQIIKKESLGVFTPACFAGQEEYDILVDGKKLGGNAQRRERDSIFQHGSVPLTLNRTILEQLFLPGFRPDPETTTDLAELGWSGSLQTLTNRLAASFEARLTLNLAVSMPSETELGRAKVLMEERYGNSNWTETGGGSLR